MPEELVKEAEALGLSIDGRWSEETLRQKIAEAKEAQDSAARDVSNKDTNQEGAKVDPVNTNDAKEVPSVGQMRSETSQEIREREAGSGLGVAPFPADAKTSHQVASELAQQGSNTPPEADTTGMQIGTELTTPIRLLYDWWDGQGIRHEHGEEIDVPMNEAIKLIGEGKAERADPLPGQR